MMNGNRVKYWIVFLILDLVLLSSGCGVFNNPGRSGQTEENQGALPEYEVVTDVEQLPLEVKSAIDFLKSRRGYYVFTPRDYPNGKDNFLFISSGAKPTGGYSLTVVSAAVAGDTLKITVQENEPAADEGVIQVITYPHLVLKINDSYQNFSVINDKNEIYAAIPAGAVPEILEGDGVYVGQIDSNFIEIEVDGQAQAFMLGPESAYPLEDLQTGDEVAISYYKNDHGQLIIIALQLTG